MQDFFHLVLFERAHHIHKVDEDLHRLVSEGIRDAEVLDVI